MKKLILLATLVSSVAFAQRTTRTTTGGDGEVNVNVGFVSSALNIGASYEKDSGNVGWGGYFNLQTEKDDAGIPQIMSLGGMMKIHLVQTNGIDAYIAPGFGLAMFSDIVVGGEEKDKTTFGPSMKIGAQYFVTPAVKVGIERFMINNWFDDEAPASAEVTTAVIGFSF